MGYFMDMHTDSCVAEHHGDDPLLVSGAGKSGSDVVHGTAGNDRMTGGAGTDYLYGDDGKDKLTGSAGDDFLSGGAGADFINGSAGIDEASYAGSSEAIVIDLDRDIAEGGDATGDSLKNIEAVLGTIFDDYIMGDRGENFFHGSGGRDSLFGAAGDDWLDGGDGDDFLVGGEGDDTLRSGQGADTIEGGEGFDTLTFWSSGEGVAVDLRLGRGFGGDANGDTYAGIEAVKGSRDHGDSLVAHDKGAVLKGYGGDDHLIGGAGADDLNGGLCCDTLEGGDGKDMLFGEDGADTLDGGDGDDLLTGGWREDILTGGGGADQFKFRKGDGADTITDYEAGLDRIVFCDGETTWRDIRTVEEEGDTIIYYGDGDSILVEDATAGEVWEMFKFF